MNTIIWLVLNSLMLGVGLAMDAFSVSLANGFADPHMKKGQMLKISGVYALFQFLMPVIGWFLVHEAVNFFTGFQKFIPWIALLLLGFIGGKLLKEGIQSKKCKRGGNCDDCLSSDCDLKEDVQAKALTTKLLLLQGIATSIDALSVGFTISEYNAAMTFVSGLIIGITTYIICFIGLKLGVKFGTKLAGNAKIVGGLILIGIGIEIFVKSFLPFA